MLLQKGQKLKLQDLGITNSFSVDCILNSSLTIDVSCFGVNSDNKLIDDRYMVFYNAKSSPNNEIVLEKENPFRFSIDTSSLPIHIEKLVFTAAIDGSQTMNALGSLDFKIGDAIFTLRGNDFQAEKAIIIAEFYKKDNVWRMGAVGQGFNGGLDALLTYFGGTQADAPQAVNVAVAETPQKVFLQKRLSLEKTLETQSPKLLNLSKKAAVSLEKRGLGDHKAQVALCLDISYSMKHLYESGLVQEFAERILALGCRLDDDGSIDIFLFGKEGYQPEPLTFKDFAGYTTRIVKQFPLEYDTRYSEAIELVRKHYTPYQYERSEPLQLENPVYVMFVTDGKPSDKAPTTRALRNASLEPIFWQFMGIGPEKDELGRQNFEYLQRLDDLDKRYIDNADFFRLSNLKDLSDDTLYEKLTNEYPGWVKSAKSKGLIK